MNIFHLIVFWCLWYLNFSSRAILSPLLPIIEQELGIGHTASGGIISFMAAGYTAAMLLAGLFSQRIGFKKCIHYGFLLLAASLFLMRYATTYLTFSVICLFIGFGSGIYLPNAIPILTEIFKRRNWGKTLSIHDSAASFSMLSVPILTAFTFQAFYWKTLFLFLGGSCVLVIMVFAKTCPDVAPPRVEKRGEFRDLIPRKDFWIMTLIWAFVSAAAMAIYNIIPLFLVNERGIALDTANTLLGISRVGGLFAVVLAGFLMDKYSVKKILVFLMVAIGLSTVMLAFVRIFPLLAAILLLQATVSLAFFPVSFVAISKLTTIHERSIFMGASIAFGSAVGIGIAMPALGLIADLHSFQTGIALQGLFVLLSCFTLKGLSRI